MRAATVAVLVALLSSPSLAAQQHQKPLTLGEMAILFAPGPILPNLKKPRPPRPPKRVVTSEEVLAAMAKAAPMSGHGAHGAMAPPDIPTFCTSPDKTADSSGPWSDTNTWAGGVVPVAGDKVKINSDVAVVYDVESAAELACIDNAGSLEVKKDADTELHVGTWQAKDDTSVIDWGTAADPVQQGFLALVEYADLGACDTGTVESPGSDPEQYCGGLIVRGNATITVHGQVRTNFVRVTDDPEAGQNVLHLENDPSGWEATWQVGEFVGLPDTSFLDNSPGNGRGNTYTPDFEECEIADIDTVANTVECVDTFTYNHFGSRIYGASSSEFFPHVAHMTRNVLFRSENPSGWRAHMLFNGRASVDMRYFVSKDMGRTRSLDIATDFTNCTVGTGGSDDGKVCAYGSGAPTHIGTNQAGRYAWHAHHLTGPTSPLASGDQFVVEGAVIRETRKWGIAVHNSHYGLISENLVYHGEGALFMTEDGSERENTFDRNAAWWARGFGGRQGGGLEGTGFYFRGDDNSVTNNICSGIVRTDGDGDANYCYKWFQDGIGNVNRPVAQGSLTTEVVWPPRDIAVRLFEDNECYGAIESCVTHWWQGAGGDGIEGAVESTFGAILGWGYYNNCWFHYQSQGATFNDVTCRGGTRGSWTGDYNSPGGVMNNWDVRGTEIGFTPTTKCEGGVFTIQNSYIQAERAVDHQILYVSDSVAEFMEECTVELVNNTYVAPPGEDLVVVQMQFTEGPVKDLTKLQRTFVRGYGGEDYQIFHLAQAADYVVPIDIYSGEEGQISCSLMGPGPREGLCARVRIGSPDSGLTNEENLELNNLAIGGEIATCETTMPEFVTAFACLVDAVAPLDVDVDVQPSRVRHTIVDSTNPFGTGGTMTVLRATNVVVGSDTVAGPYSVSNVLAADEAHTLVVRWTKDGETTVTRTAVVLDEYEADDETVSGTVTVTRTLERCKFTVIATPPDSAGSWRGRIFRNSTIRFGGSDDKTVDVYAVRIEDLGLGTFPFTVLWTKNGESDVTTSPAVNGTCSGS